MNYMLNSFQVSILDSLCLKLDIVTQAVLYLACVVRLGPLRSNQEWFVASFYICLVVGLLEVLGHVWLACFLMSYHFTPWSWIIHIIKGCFGIGIAYQHRCLHIVFWYTEYQISKFEIVLNFVNLKCLYDYL